MLLARLMEQSVGMPLATFLARTIFAPLAMASTGVGRAAPRPQHAATGYSGRRRTRVFDAVNTCLPDDEAAVIVLTNGEDTDTDTLGLRLAQEVHG